MTVETAVAAHYTTGRLIERIRGALAELGIEAATAEDLKPVDEFHIGGAAATRDLLAQVPLGPEAQVLDIGSGLGGTARVVAETTGAQVTGIDLTPEFVEAARALSEMVGMAERTRFVVGSALVLPFGDAAFDAATLIHVGMNVPDKRALMAEAARVLRTGGIFAVYDVMRTGEGEVAYPVPWAEGPGTSFLATPDEYLDAAEAAGLRCVARRERRELAVEFFRAMQARLAEGPPPLGIHLVMPANRPAKMANMVRNVEAGLCAPVEMLFRKE